MVLQRKQSSCKIGEFWKPGSLPKGSNLVCHLWLSLRQGSQLYMMERVPPMTIESYPRWKASAYGHGTAHKIVTT